MTDADEVAIMRLIIHGAMSDGISPDEADRLIRVLHGLRAENARLWALLDATSAQRDAVQARFDELVAIIRAKEANHEPS